MKVRAEHVRHSVGKCFVKRDWQKCFYGQFINLKHLKENFDIFGGGKGDHRESENRTLNGNWTLLSY